MEEMRKKERAITAIDRMIDYIQKEMPEDGYEVYEELLARTISELEGLQILLRIELQVK